MDSNFLKAFTKTLHDEGGYSNHPADRGGETNWGITSLTLEIAKRQGWVKQSQTIKSLTQEESQIIYYEMYWKPLKLDEVLNGLISSEIFDTAVNMGTTAAIRIVQRSLNFLGESLIEDGIIGFNTLSRLNFWSKKDPQCLFICLNGFQFIRYVEITELNPSQRVFFRGWTKRIQQYHS
ncbi:MAG: glycosyl hydrolase 108 family protein [Bacteroidota bacterium]